MWELNTILVRCSLLFVATGLLMLPGCGSSSPNAAALKVELAEIRIASTGLVSENVVLTISLHNPTNQPIATTGMAADFFLNGRLISQSNDHKHIPVPARGGVQITLVGPVNAEALIHRNIGQIDGRTLDYQVRGNTFTGQFGSAGRPYQLSGNLLAIAGGKRAGNTLTAGLF